MICPRCDGSGTTSPTDELDAERCWLCDGSGEAPSMLPCGHPTVCYQRHGERGSSCAWCLDLMESVSARCRRTGYQACIRCDDLDCGDNTSDAAATVRQLRAEVEKWRDRARTYSSAGAHLAADATKKRIFAEAALDALGICHAAMERHDESGLHVDDDPAGACFVDFAAEREIAARVLGRRGGEDE